MSVNFESALSKAKDLKDETLEKALQLARGDEKLFQPRFEFANEGVDVPSDESSPRDAMCPDLYRAILSGSINDANKLLGQHLTEDIGNEVQVLLEEPRESRVATNNHWGDRVHGDGQCTLQEITAEKNTLLHIAAKQGHVELVEQIAKKDSTLLESKNSRHESPLHLAARAGKHQIVSLILLLAQKSGIGAYKVLTKKNIQGDTVLHEAARHGHEDVVKVLMIVAPALSAEVNKSSMSPLYLAVFRKSIGIVKALVEYTHTSAVGPNQQNALHAAVLGSREIASILLDWKAALANERDVTGSTPMHYAASSTGDTTVLRNILDKMPCSVYIQDREGSSPLHVAAKMYNYSSILCMISRCPDSFELCDNHGRNFLHIVAQHDRKFSIFYHSPPYITSLVSLFRRRPDLKCLVNEADNEGNTPLHFASENSFSEVILQLLKVNEADTRLMNNEGKTALDRAVSETASMSFFHRVDAVTTLSFFGAIFSPQRQDLLEMLIGKKVEWINKVSENLIVVSVLIATVAFSAAFNVPGSYNGDGVANLHQNIQYQFFLVLDGIAMSSSISAAMLLVTAKALGRRSWTCFALSLNFLWISLFAMELAFVIAVSVSLGSGRTSTKYIILCTSTFMFAGIGLIGYYFGSPANIKMRITFLLRQTPTLRQAEIQLPLLLPYLSLPTWFISLNALLCFAATVIIANLPAFKN